MTAGTYWKTILWALFDIKFKEMTNISESKKCHTTNIKEQEDNHEYPKIPTATKIVKMRELGKRKMTLKMYHDWHNYKIEISGS